MQYGGLDWRTTKPHRHSNTTNNDDQSFISGKRRARTLRGKWKKTPCFQEEVQELPDNNNNNHNSNGNSYSLFSNQANKLLWLLSLSS